MPLLAQLRKAVDLPVSCSKRVEIAFWQSAGWRGQELEQLYLFILGSGVGIGVLWTANSWMQQPDGRRVRAHYYRSRCEGSLQLRQARLLGGDCLSPNIVRQYLAKMDSPGNGAASCSVAEVFAAARRRDSAAMEVLDRVCKCLAWRFRMSRCCSTLNCWCWVVNRLRRRCASASP